MKYVVLSDWTPERLVELVNNAIADGWEPQGGLCFVQTQSFATGSDDRLEGRFYQAMIKRSK